MSLSARLVQSYCLGCLKTVVIQHSHYSTSRGKMCTRQTPPWLAAATGSLCLLHRRLDVFMFYTFRKAFGDRNISAKSGIDSAATGSPTRTCKSVLFAFVLSNHSKNVILCEAQVDRWLQWSSQHCNHAGNFEIMKDESAYRHH